MFTKLWKRIGCRRAGPPLAPSNFETLAVDREPEHVGPAEAPRGYQGAIADPWETPPDQPDQSVTQDARQNLPLQPTSQAARQTLHPELEICAAGPPGELQLPPGKASYGPAEILLQDALKLQDAPADLSEDVAAAITLLYWLRSKLSPAQMLLQDELKVHAFGSESFAAGIEQALALLYWLAELTDRGEQNLAWQQA